MAEKVSERISNNRDVGPLGPLYDTVLAGPLSGLRSAATGLVNVASALPANEIPKPVLPLTTNTFNDRVKLFDERLNEVKGKSSNPNARLITPVTGDMLEAMYGRDVIQKAINDGLIDIG